MTFAIREMHAGDAEVWAEMRQALWPSTTRAENRNDIAKILAAPDMWAFIALDEAGMPAAFAEVSLRRYVNGCEETPAAFLEGIWTAAAYRRRGLGDQLVAYIGDFLKAKGFRELCSDALLDNTASHAAHRSWGFAETERVVYFRKHLS